MCSHENDDLGLYWSGYRPNRSPFSDSTINTQQRLVNKALCRLWPTNVRLHISLTLILSQKQPKDQDFEKRVSRPRLKSGEPQHVLWFVCRLLCCVCVWFQGYVVLGSNGECSYLTVDERVEMVRQVRCLATRDRLVIAGAGCECKCCAPVTDLRYRWIALRYWTIARLHHHWPVAQQWPMTFTSS